MFVTTKTYNELIRKYNELNDQHTELLGKHNELVIRINQLGGEVFLAQGEHLFKSSQFTRDDVDKLVRLCHPDRHGGKESAIEMTQKLLSMRQ